MSETKQWYVIRRGWNAANQSSAHRPAKPRDNFDSGYYALIAVVDAASEDEATRAFGGMAYHNQYLFAVSSPRMAKGLTRVLAEREVSDVCSD
jgi:hypothetical protein